MKLTNKKFIPFLVLSILIFIASSCSSEIDDADSKKINEGEIIYEIKYPTYKRKKSILFKILPKKMITTFSDNCYKNDFIFSNNALSLTIISDCNSKQTTLSYCDGARKKFTKVDSISIHQLLNQLPKYNKLNDYNEPTVFLTLPSKKIELTCKEEETQFDVITSNTIQINDMNWCTPFHEIDDVLLSYQMTQFGIDMEFNAIEINEKEIESNEFVVDESFEIETIDKYLDEIKMFFSIF